MREIEVKAKLVNKEKTMLKLKDLGCEFSEEIFQHDQNFIHEDLKYEDVTIGTPVLRLRNNGKEIKLTMKKLLGTNGLEKLERETIVSDLFQAKEILKNAYLHKVMDIKKTRIKTNYNDLEICIDNVEHLGQFIEVEKLVDNENVSADDVQEELFKFLESLGIKREDRIKVGYDMMLIGKY